MPPRTYLSGARKRQLKRERNAFDKSQQGSFLKFLTKPTTPTEPAIPTEHDVRTSGEFHDQTERVDEAVDFSPEDSFRISYFLQAMDQALYSLETRFEQFQKYEQTFGFLFDLEKLKSASNDSLLASCTNLEASLKHGNHSDIIGDDLFLN